MSITAEGRRRLRSDIGVDSYVESYVQMKVLRWVIEVVHLSSIAVTKAHAAYTAFIKGLTRKWTFLARTIPDIEDSFMPLE